MRLEVKPRKIVVFWEVSGSRHARYLRLVVGVIYCGSLRGKKVGLERPGALVEFEGEKNNDAREEY